METIDLIQSEIKFYGLFRGIVCDNYDPRSLKRLRVKIPDVCGEELSGWAMPCFPNQDAGVSGKTSICSNESQ